MFCTLVQFQHDIDISEFLKCIRDKHEEARVYVAAQDAKLELQSIWKKLQDIEAENERCPLRSVYLKTLVNKVQFCRTFSPPLIRTF